MRLLLLLPTAVLLTLVGCASEVRDENTGGSGPTAGGSGVGGAGPSTTTSASTGASGGGTSTATSSSSGTSSTGGGGPGGGTSFTACDSPGSCTLAPKGCCAPCGDPSLDDYDAIHVDAVESHADAVCPDDAACPPCEPAHDPDLFAYCDTGAGRCVGADLRDTDLVSCSGPDDCTLRPGTTCCLPCGEPSDDPEDWVALASVREGDLEQLVCEPGHGCPECEPPRPPAHLFAGCVEGVCTVVELEDEP